jgi:gliding motility-associated protein GldM
MAGGNLSPRQRMINMMYLVLTALLALNVSKEVLNSFFEVNLGIERSTTNFNAKNGDTYAAFDAAAELNKVKAGTFRDQAYEVKASADELVEFIQEMKYNLVLAADKKVYLGSQLELKDEDGDLLEDKAIITPWDELSDAEKKMTIGNLTVKDDRHASGDLFYSAKRKENIATDLKNSLISYKNSLLSISEGNESLITSINETCNYDDKKVKGKKQLWEEYNFYDMPSVGALTLLSKMQSDVRNTEADVITMLRENIDATSLKFTTAEGIQIPQSNFVLRGDSFRAQIFISAKDTTQDPMIYVGEYDSLGNGNYQMKGAEGIDYEVVKVVNGKGIFSERASSEGMKNWGGLIAMKTASGTKTYPFKGKYLVAAKTAVVSPVNMNVLYLEVDNPLEVSVPGYTAGEVTAVINNGKILATKKSSGEWSARPSKKGKAMVSLYANVEGKRTKMGEKDFRVKEVPPPKAEVRFAADVNGELFIDKMKMVTAGGLSAKLKDFDFKGVRYMVVSFKLTGMYKGEQQSDLAKSPKFTDKMIGIIKNTKSGNTITISNINARRVDAKNTGIRNLDPVVLTIK